METQDLTLEDLARLPNTLTLKERYMRAIGIMLSGAVWPGMVGSSDHARLVNALCRLRLVLSSDELVNKYKVSTVPEVPERLLQRTLEARMNVMTDYPRLLEFLIPAVREALVMHAPLALPDQDVGVLNGLKGAELDVILAGIGYRLGEGARMQALRVLEAAGEVRCTTAYRWNAVAPLWPPADPKEAQAFHRFCMLSMLERVVAQRFVGMPNLLWLMGFNETPAGRAAMGRRLGQGARAWLESRSLTLAQARSGHEAELVWVQTAVMIARRPLPRYPLPEWLRRELELTVMPATLLRLGLGEQGERFLKRALTERAERWVKQERKRRVELKKQKLPPGPLPKGLDIRWESLNRWREWPSFESGDLRDTSPKYMVPKAMFRVQELLHEALPAALTLRQIYDHALRHWPVEFHSLELLERACMQLVAGFQVAENRVPGPERILREVNWVKGFKAIKLEFSPPELSQNHMESLTGFIEEILQCLAEPDPEDPPFIETSRFLIPRDALGEFQVHMRQLREEHMAGLHSVYGDPDLGELSSIGAIFSVIGRLPVDL